MSSPRLDRALAGQLGVLLVALPLAHVTGLRNLLAFLLFASVLALLVRERPRLPATVWAMAPWIAIGSASMLWSPDPRVTLHAVVYATLLPAAVFLAAWRVSRDSASFDRMRGAACAGFLLLAAIALFTLARHGQTMLQQDSGLAGPAYYWPGVGVASTFAVYAAPFAFLALASGAGRERAFGALLLAAAVFVVWLTENRISWPALLLAGVAFLAGIWVLLEPWARKASIALLLTAAVAGGAAFVHVTRERAGAAPVAQFLSNDPRVEGYKDWIGVAARSPVAGRGLGRAIIHWVGERDLPAELKRDAPSFAFHAHNVFLDIFVQLGALGLAAYAALLAALLSEYWRLGARGPRRELRHVGAAALALLVAMLAKNSTDDFMDQATGLAFWAYAGMLLGRLEAARAAIAPARAVADTRRAPAPR